ncbi:hypothetical protein Goklo_024197 [Gossypium klotzschianum]|uniref:DUF7745 domain-containing protein n=2 Tax=Gossypium klotzschianum TaxID=34286 RepID=A0A7J8WER9_9ROSI|nr:hypothetical protein [Gossypium klotzschianum]
MTQNSLQELKDIWEHWDNGIKQLFYSNYGDLSFLVDIKVDKRLFRALAQYWNPAYSCFTFRKVDLVPTVEEYTTLLRCLKTQIDKAYSRTGNVPTYLKKLMCITGMSKQWVAARIKQKGDSKCIPWKNLRDLVLAHPDVKKRVDIFVLSIYGLVIFPKALGHVDEVVSDLFDRLDKGVTPVPAILAESFRSLNACQRTGEGRTLLSIKGSSGYTEARRHHEIKEEKTKVDQWEKKFQVARARESALEKNLLECQNEEAKLKARVAELEKSLHLYRSHGSMIELRASLIQADVLSLKYESESDRGRELAWLLRKVKALSLKTKLYM